MRSAVLFLCLLLLGAAPASAASSAPALPLPGSAAPLVVIDPGHGGDKDGAIGPGGLKEKDVALEVSLRLAAELRQRGVRVLLTRETDVGLGLAVRAEIAQREEADLFVSIHANAVGPQSLRRRVSGVETYFLSAEATDAQAAALAEQENADEDDDIRQSNDPLSAILADLARGEAHRHASSLAVAIHQRLVAATGSRDRGVRQAPFLVLQGATMPAVLVEIGYISHPDESRRLADPEHQERIARAIADGIADFGGRLLAAWSRPRGEDAQER